MFWLSLVLPFCACVIVCCLLSTFLSLCPVNCVVIMDVMFVVFCHWRDTGGTTERGHWQEHWVRVMFGSCHCVCVFCRCNCFSYVVVMFVLMFAAVIVRCQCYDLMCVWVMAAPAEVTIVWAVYLKSSYPNIVIWEHILHTPFR